MGTSWRGLNRWSWIRGENTLSRSRQVMRSEPMSCMLRSSAITKRISFGRLRRSLTLGMGEVLVEAMVLLRELGDNEIVIVMGFQYCFMGLGIFRDTFTRFESKTRYES